MEAPKTKSALSALGQPSSYEDASVFCSRCGGLKQTVIDGQLILPKGWEKALDVGMAADIWCIC